MLIKIFLLYNIVPYDFPYNISIQILKFVFWPAHAHTTDVGLKRANFNGDKKARAQTTSETTSEREQRLKKRRESDRLRRESESKEQREAG